MGEDSGCTIYWMMFIAAVVAIGLIVGKSTTAIDLTLLIIIAASLLILISYECDWLIDNRTGREMQRPKEDIWDEESK